METRPEPLNPFSAFQDGGLGLIDSCEISGNRSSGVKVDKQGNPVIAANNIHDNGGFGVLVTKDAKGLAKIDRANLFARNVAGEVRRILV